MKHLLRQLANAFRLSMIDRYIMKKFIGTFFFSLLLIICVVIVFDFNERIDKFTGSHAPWQKIVIYYLNYIPYFANLLSSLFVFISVILFTSKLADNSEIIAMRSSGISFNRLLKPYMITAGLIALTSYLLGGYVIPQCNEKRIDFESQYIRKQQVTDISNAQLQVSPGTIAFFQSFSITTRRGFNFSLDKFSGKKMVSHLTASRIEYDTLSDVRYKWKLYNYNIRHFKGMHEKVESGSQMDTIIEVEPSDLLYTRNQQETMTTPQIREYINKQKKRGAANVSTFEVEYYKRIASAFAAFILTFIGVSLSCEKKKGGMGLSLGIGLGLSFSYILFSTISASFAINANWPPLLAVWIPNFIFFGISLYLYRRTPK